MGITTDKIKVDDKEIRTLNIDGNIYISATQLSLEYGYRARFISDKIKQDKTYVNGIDFLNINGDILNAVKNLDSDFLRSSDRRYNILCLTAKGLLRVFKDWLGIVPNALLKALDINTLPVGAIRPIETGYCPKIDEKIKENNSIYVGIDPGLKGGIAVINGALILLDHWQIPRIDDKNVDDKKVKELLQKYKGRIDCACIEQVGAKQGENSFSISKSGSQAGFLRGLLLGFDVPNIFKVEPIVWQRSILPTKNKNNRTTKERSIRFANKSYGLNLDLKKEEDGISDAICIALYSTELIKNCHYPKEQYPKEQDKPFRFKY